MGRAFGDLILDRDVEKWLEDTFYSLSECGTNFILPDERLPSESGVMGLSLILKLAYTQKKENRMAFSEILNGLSNAVGDLCSLSVETYTGKITAEIKKADGKSVIDWEELIKEARKDAGGVVHLKLASKFNIDGDATLFIAEGGIPSDLRDAHDSAVNAGQTVRADLMDLLGESIKKLV